MATKHQAAKTALAPPLIDGKNVAELIRELHQPGLTNGEAIAYQMGTQAAAKNSYENPLFTTYSERIAYRAGWLTQKKKEISA